MIEAGVASALTQATTPGDTVCPQATRFQNSVSSPQTPRPGGLVILTDAGGLHTAPRAVRLAGPAGGAHQDEGWRALEGHFRPEGETSATEPALRRGAGVPTEHSCGGNNRKVSRGGPRGQVAC